MGAEHLGDCPYDVLTVAAAPQECSIPELPDESVQGSDRPVEKLRGHREVDRVSADDECLEDLQMPPVEPVQGPLNARACACACGQRGQVTRRRPCEVGSTSDQPAELLITSTPDVVGEAPDGGGWSGRSG